jgi:protein-tyrosine phosphatase
MLVKSPTIGRRLIARRPGRLILNLVDVNDVNYVGASLVDAALDTISDNISASKILLHCNLGQSRSPTIALLYLAKHTDRFRGFSIEDAVAAFRGSYPSYAPAQGMADYARLNWVKYAA